MIDESQAEQCRRENAIHDADNQRIADALGIQHEGGVGFIGDEAVAVIEGLKRERDELREKEQAWAKERKGFIDVKVLEQAARADAAERKCDLLREECRRFAKQIESADRAINAVAAERDNWKAGAAEVKKDVDHWMAVCRDQRAVLEKNYWNWQGDGDDHLESLTCPIIIRPDELRAIFAERDAANEAIGVEQANRNKLMNSLVEMSKERDAARADFLAVAAERDRLAGDNAGLRDATGSLLVPMIDEHKGHHGECMLCNGSIEDEQHTDKCPIGKGYKALTPSPAPAYIPADKYWGLVEEIHQVMSGYDEYEQDWYRVEAIIDRELKRREGQG